MSDPVEAVPPATTPEQRIRNLVAQLRDGLHTLDEMPGLVLATLDRSTVSDDGALREAAHSMSEVLRAMVNADQRTEVGAFMLATNQALDDYAATPKDESDAPLDVERLAEAMVRLTDRQPAGPRGRRPGLQPIDAPSLAAEYAALTPQSESKRPEEGPSAPDLRSLLWRILTSSEYDKMEAEGLAADALGLRWSEADDRYVGPDALPESER